jgi:hypothetical protein
MDTQSVKLLISPGSCTHPEDIITPCSGRIAPVKIHFWVQLEGFDLSNVDVSTQEGLFHYTTQVKLAIYHFAAIVCPRLVESNFFYTEFIINEIFKSFDSLGRPMD